MLIRCAAITAACTATACIHALWRLASPNARPTRQVTGRTEKLAASMMASMEEETDEVGEEPWGNYGPVAPPPPPLAPGEIRVQVRVGGVEPPVTHGTGLLGRVHTRPGRQSAAKRAASHVRAKIGSPVYSKANELVVSRLARDFLAEQGVRATHIAAIAPLATALVFIRTNAEIEAREIMGSAEAVQRREAYDARYYTHVCGSGPLGWLRRRRVYTEPPTV